MSDGGKHFDNKEVRELCRKWRMKTHIVPAYSPWVNCLIKGTNKLFLRILKQLCIPDLDNEEAEKITTDDLPKHWPDHFKKTLKVLNWRLLLALKFFPKELMLGLVVNIKPADLDSSILPIMENDTALQMAYISQQHLNGYAEAVIHALKRKAAFDKKVLAQKPGEVIFSKRQLVQIYQNDLDFMFKTEHKLLLKWSAPQQVVSRHLNSLETLNGNLLPGSFSVRRFQTFIPREGTKLTEEQRLIEEHNTAEEQGRERTSADEDQSDDNPPTRTNPDLQTSE